MTKNADKKSGFFTVRYVSFSSSNVSVDLNKFLSTDRGRAIVKSAVKPKKNTLSSGRVVEASMLEAG